MMKKLSLLILSATASLMVRAQYTIPFSIREQIDVGNIRAAHLVHGDMWFDPKGDSAICEFPKGSGKNLAYTNNILMGGFDNLTPSNFRFSGFTYRSQSACTYWPGPIDTPSKSVAYATSQKWARIWNVNWRQIDTFRHMTAHTVSNTPLPILEWPAIGNPYAKGAGGVSLTITQPLAPFVDVNKDGLYNPLLGDYPLLKGDQMLWWVINDNGTNYQHAMSTQLRLGVQIQITAYAFGRNTTVDNIIFYEYLVKNRSAQNYNNYRIGMFCDLDLGYSFDDYIGFDSTHRLGIVYNGNPTDGNGGYHEYGNNPPAAGVAVLEMPGDTYGNYYPVGSVTCPNNSFGPDGDPTNATEMFRLMNSRNRIDSALSGNRRYQYNEDSECVNNHLSGDRRIIISSGSMTLLAGDSIKFSTALVAAQIKNCPSLELTNLYMVADTAYKYYWNPPPMQTTSVQAHNPLHLRIYPNPAKSILYIDGASISKGSVSIYNAMGQACSVAARQSGDRLELNIAALPAGIYSVRYTDGDQTGSSLFVKE